MSSPSPQNWGAPKFKELFKKFTSKGHQQEELLSVTQNHGVIPRRMLEGRVMAPQGGTNSYKLIESGDFAVSLRSFQGGIEFSKFKGLISPAYTVLRPTTEICPDFYRHYFKSSAFIEKELYRVTIGIRDGKQISIPDLMHLSVPTPPLHEQKKIAAILSSVDEAINATQAVIDQTRKVKEGLLQDLLTRGIGHTRFKQTEIGEIPEEWVDGKVDDFIVLQRGFDITKKQRGQGSVPVVSSSGVAYYHNEYKVSHPGVVTGRKGKLGLVHYMTQDFWPHDTTLWVKDFKGNDPRFIYWYLIGFGLEKFDAATAVPTLNRNVVHREPAAFPPIEEQKAITVILDEVDNSIQAEEAKLAQLQQTKRGLMQDLLSGDVRVHI
ncbi:restriction endonuclease subunit S [Pseudodesulfovibrio sediminis]|uniref:Type I restriction modification system subunit S n=1 Tax=Pseudodesulfovibrio sediminis TaxID=2810563 RepID=A0ABM7P8V2_9BACT|nr:restriction endonuclease subunit S [Pseudodesulfovibrio sediminis]BCS89467.1 type I restriction modification system subunit S [Pseudodesulfovibrio sediminis]